MIFNEYSIAPIFHNEGFSAMLKVIIMQYCFCQQQQTTVAEILYATCGCGKARDLAYLLCLSERGKLIEMFGAHISSPSFRLISLARTLIIGAIWCRL